MQRAHLFPAVLLLAALFCSSLLYSQDVYHNCPMEGDAKVQSAKDLNLLKNRYTFPVDVNMDQGVTLKKMLKRGHDADRFDEEKAVTIQGYVFDVKPGGIETCNCHAKDQKYRDTHIELILKAGDDEKIRRVIVEVTPRIRAVMKAKGIDWSTKTLKENFKGKIVQVTGWLFFDQEHADEAENTAPGREKNWRATAWEVHPVTEIKIVE